MKLFKWNTGRQNTGYKIFPFYMSTHFDLYIIKGTNIPEHKDPIYGRKHYRLNYIFWNTAIGGNFNCNDMIFESKRIKFFRPDINFHSVDEIYSGTRLVLSIGYSIINNDKEK